MAYQMSTFPAFGGVRMDLCDQLLNADASPDACNVDTRSGALRSATGFSKTVPDLLDTDEPLTRLYVYSTQNGDRYFAVTRDAIYLYRAAQRDWHVIFRFGVDTPGDKLDFLKVRIGSDDRLLIANGSEQMLAFDAATDEAEFFGSAEKLSDKPVCFAELYFGRLFCAGDRTAPSRLYWSKAPGDGRAIDDWRSDSAGENVSGGHVDVGVDDDPITGLFAMSNQLVIVKRDSMYRLLGDRPSNYRIVKIDASFRQPLHTACVRYADRLFFLTDTGLCWYDGQSVRRSAGSHALAPLLKQSDLSVARAAANDDLLYFAFGSRVGLPCNDVVVEYDVQRDRFMQRSGFTAADLCASHGTLYGLTGAGKLVEFDNNNTYDGDPIHAYWQTPRIDFGHKETTKTLLSLIASGSGRLRVRAASNGGVYETDTLLSSVDNSVTEIPLRGKGRMFTLRFSSVNGAPFTLDAPVALLFDQQRRPM